MANYYSTARTNYFSVKNVDAFKKWLESFAGAELETGEGEDESKFCLLFDEGMPSYKEDENGEELEDFDFIQELAQHLADGEVAVYIEAGAEKMRYVNGYAIAVNNKGETENVNLDVIYVLAKRLGSNVTRAEY